MEILYCITVFLAVLGFIQSCVVTRFDQVPVALQICDEIILDSLTVPAGETLKLTLRSGTTVKFRGTTTFSYYEWEGPLVEINGTDVVIQGEEDSLLYGQGELYWDGHGEWGEHYQKPKFFTLQLHNAVMSDINILNNPLHCALLTDSSNVTLTRWNIDASSGDELVPGLGKIGVNTDGFDIWNSTDVVLTDSVVHNQDDCVAVRCGANILVEDFVCYGGHGLSLSVGFSNDTYKLNLLQNVTIRNSVLKGGYNGIHIKTHVDGGLGLIQNITYQNIEFEDIDQYGIKIHENYVNLPVTGTLPDNPKNNVPIRDLKMINIVGTVLDSAVPIYVLCAEEGCFDWEFTNVIVEGTNPNNCSYLPTNFAFEC